MRTQRRIVIVILVVTIGCLAVLAVPVAWFGVWPGAIVGVTTTLVVNGCYVISIGPWQRRWGATDAEVDRAMPGDEILGPGAPSTTRAIKVDAPPDQVFPWLMQIGYGRGGWYSYDWLDNDGKPSVDRIDPGLQRLAPGDRIEMLPGMGPVVREIEQNHHIVSAGEADSWCLLVESPGAEATRLISRWRQDWPASLATLAWIAVADPGAFVMERKMLRTIRWHAERRSQVPLDPVPSSLDAR
jgi:hypothetical protein